MSIISRPDKRVVLLCCSGNPVSVMEPRSGEMDLASMKFHTTVSRIITYEYINSPYSDVMTGNPAPPPLLPPQTTIFLKSVVNN